MFGIFKSYKQKAFEYLLKHTEDIQHLPLKEKKKVLKLHLDYCVEQGFIDKDYRIIRSDLK